MSTPTIPTRPPTPEAGPSGVPTIGLPKDDDWSSCSSPLSEVPEVIINPHTGQPEGIVGCGEPADQQDQTVGIQDPPDRTAWRKKATPRSRKKRGTAAATPSVAPSPYFSPASRPSINLGSATTFTSSERAFTYPDPTNPDLVQPALIHPDPTNPDLIHPDLLNPDFVHPELQNFDPNAFDPSTFDPSTLDWSLIDPTLLNQSFIDPNLSDPTLFDPTLYDPTLYDLELDFANFVNPDFDFNTLGPTPSTGASDLNFSAEPSDSPFANLEDLEVRHQSLPPVSSGHPVGNVEGEVPRRSLPPLLSDDPFDNVSGEFPRLSTYSGPSDSFFVNPVDLEIHRYSPPPLLSDHPFGNADGEVSRWSTAPELSDNPWANFEDLEVRRRSPSPVPSGHPVGNVDGDISRSSTQPGPSNRTSADVENLEIPQYSPRANFRILDGNFPRPTAPPVSSGHTVGTVDGDIPGSSTQPGPSDRTSADVENLEIPQDSPRAIFRILEEDFPNPTTPPVSSGRTVSNVDGDVPQSSTQPGPSDRTSANVENLELPQWEKPQGFADVPQSSTQPGPGDRTSANVENLELPQWEEPQGFADVDKEIPRSRTPPGPGGHIFGDGEDLELPQYSPRVDFRILDREFTHPRAPPSLSYNPFDNDDDGLCLFDNGDDPRRMDVDSEDIDDYAMSEVSELGAPRGSYSKGKKRDRMDLQKEEDPTMSDDHDADKDQGSANPFFSQEQDRYINEHVKKMTEEKAAEATQAKEQLQTAIAERATMERAASEEINRLKTELDYTKSSSTTFESTSFDEIKRLKAELEEAKKSASVSKNISDENARLTTELNQIRSARSTAESKTSEKIKGLKADLKKIKSESSTAESKSSDEIKRLGDVNNTNTETIDRLLKVAKDLQDEKGVMEATIDRHETMIELMQEEGQRLVNVNEGLVNKNEAMEKDIEGYRGTIDGHDNTINDQKTSLSDQARKLSNSERDYQIATERVVELEKIVANKDDAFGKASERERLLRIDVAQMRTERDQANGVVDSRGKRIEELEKEVSEMTPAIEALTRKIAEHEERTASFEVVQGQLAKRNLLLDELRIQISGLEEDVKFYKEFYKPNRKQTKFQVTLGGVSTESWSLDSEPSSEESSDDIPVKYKTNEQKRRYKKKKAEEKVRVDEAVRLALEKKKMDDAFAKSFPPSRFGRPHKRRAARLALLDANAPYDTDETPSPPTTPDYVACFDDDFFFNPKSQSAGTQTVAIEPSTPAPPPQTVTRYIVRTEMLPAPPPPTVTQYLVRTEMLPAPPPPTVTQYLVRTEKLPAPPPPPAQTLTRYIVRTVTTPRSLPTIPLLFVILLAAMTILIASLVTVLAAREHQVWSHANDLSRLTFLTWRAQPMRRGAGIIGWLLGDPTKGMEGGMWG